jgi:hypothetical protein
MPIDLILLNYIHVGYLIMFTQQNPMEYLAMMIIRRNNGPCTNGSSTVQLEFFMASTKVL